MSSLKDLASLIMVPSLYKDGELHTVKPLADENIIVHPDATDNNDGVDGTTPSTSSNFTFSRGSNLAATRVDVNGLIEKGRENVLLQSNAFDNAVWDNQLGGSVTGGQTGYDGTNDAWLLNKSATSYRHIRQLNLSASGVYNYSIYAKANTLDQITIFNDVSGTNPYARFSLVDGSIVASSGLIDSSAVDVGNGWWRLSATFNDTITTARIYPDFGQTNAGSIYIQDAQLEQGLVATDYIETGTSAAQSGILEDMPRLDYSGGASCPALLLEPQRSNQIRQSEYFGGWSGSATRTDNYAISPEGVKNAAMLEANSGVGNGVVFIAQVSSSTLYKGSVYVKSAGATTGKFRFFDGSTGQSTTTTFTPTSEWTRVEVQRTSGSSTSQIRADIFDNDGDLLLYGAQMEAGSYPTSYIPTYGTSQTRSGDDTEVVDLNTNQIFGQNSGTIFLDIKRAVARDSTEIVWQWKDTNNAIAFRLYYKEAGECSVFTFYNNRDNEFVTANTTIGYSPKIAISYDGTSRLEVFGNGSKIAKTGGNFQSNVALDKMQLLNSLWNVTEFKGITFFPTALTDSECIALTTL